MLTILKLRKLSGMSKGKFHEYFNIPRTTASNWESKSDAARRECPPYLIELMTYKLIHEGIITPSQVKEAESDEDD